jgi:hypothetical protein
VLRFMRLVVDELRGYGCTPGICNETARCGRHHRGLGLHSQVGCLKSDPASHATHATATHATHALPMMYVKVEAVPSASRI